MRRALCLWLWVCVGCAGVREKGSLVPHPELTQEQLANRAGRRLALLIGVNQTRDELWPALRYAAKDALDLARVLADPAQGRFETEVLSTGPTTTRAAVLDALGRLEQRNTSANDVVVVYFSGHGTLAKDEVGGLERVLVTSDTAHAQARATGLSLGELERRFEGLRSRRKALVLAACHSGTGKSVLTPEVEAQLQGVKGPRPLSEVSRGVMTLSAAAFGESAREDDRLGHDIYTSFLLEALTQRRDRNHDGAVSAEEAHDWARERTYYFTEGRQTPTAQITVVGVDPVVLVGDPSGAGLPVLGSWGEPLSGARLKVDGRVKGTLPGGVAVEPGAHEVEVTLGDEVLAQAQVSLSPGEQLELESLVWRDSGWSLGARLGTFLFVTPTLHALVGGPVPTAMGSVGKQFGPWRGALEVAGGVLDGQVAPEGVSTPVRFGVLQVGVGAHYTLELGRLRLFTGPQVDFTVMWRTPLRAAVSQTDTAFMTAPGWLLEARWAFTPSLELAASLKGSYAAMRIDGETTHLGAVSLGVGAAWRFGR